MNMGKEIVLKDTQEEEAAFDYMHYLLLFRRHALKQAVFTVLVVAIALLVVMNMTPSYTAKSTLQIEDSQTNVVSIQDVYGTPKNREYLATQFEILKSRELARRVVVAQNLTSVPEFNTLLEPSEEGFSIKASMKDLASQYLGYSGGADSTEQETDPVEVATSELLNHFHSYSIQGTSLAVIAVSSQNPVLARDLANAFGREYINFKLQEKLGVTEQASEWMKDRLSVLKSQLEESERKLQEYRIENNLVDLKGVDTLITQEISGITSQLSQARARRLELEAMYNRLNEINDNDEALLSIPAIVNHPSVTALVEQESLAALKVSELSNTYGYKHPKIISAKTEHETSKEALLRQMSRVAQSIRSEYLASKTTETLLLQSLDRIKSEAGEINKNEFTVNMLMREVESNRQLYDMFFKRINETSATGDLEVPNAIITDPAVVPEWPSRPEKAKILAMAFVASIVLGLGVIILLDFLDATIKNVGDLEKKLRAPVLGILPLLGGKKARKSGQDDSAAKAFTENAQQNFSEAVRTIRTTLRLSVMDPEDKVILVTSSVPGEGKTTVACNIAQAFGQIEKTLIIDADMRRPTVAKKLGLLAYAPGLSNAISHPENLDQFIQQSPELGIDVLSSGPVPENPLELLSSYEFSTLLETLRERYQRIIIDSAPMHAVSDALYLSVLTDGVVYVVKADDTRDKVALSGIQNLVQNNARVLGTILNQVDVEREAKYGNLNYGYYDSYGYSSKSK